MVHFGVVEVLKSLGTGAVNNLISSWLSFGTLLTSLSFSFAVYYKI